MIKQLVYTIVITILLTFVITTAFSFFGIGFEIYGNYLLWFIALVVLYFYAIDRIFYLAQY
jgi:hypothetical protein